MKKSIVTIVVIIALCTQIRPQEKGRQLESLVPDSLYLLARTANLGDCIRSARFVIDRILSDSDRAKALDGIARIEKKSGVNFLDEASLGKAGIDLSRRAAAAYYPEAKEGEERICLFIPVLDEKSFPLAFVEILRKTSGKVGADMYPAVTPYRSRNIQQIGKDIFTSSVEGYFVITSTGELLKKVIDTAEDGAGSIALDPVFSNYIQKKKDTPDIDLFMKKEFLSDIAGKFMEFMNGGRDDKTATGKGPLDELVPGPMTDKQEPEKDQGRERVHADEWFTSVNYATIGISIRKGRLLIEGGADLNATIGRAGLLLDSIRNGALGSALYSPDANTLFLLAMDFGRVESLCRDDTDLCQYYARLKKKILDDFAIDVAADVIPSCAGPVSFFMGSDSYPTLNSSSVLYFPLKDAGSSRALAEKTAVRLQSLGKKGDVWDETEIKGAKAFWYVTPSGRKTHTAFDKRGVFLGNSADLIETCMGGGKASSAKKGDDIIGRTGSDTFLLALVKKNSFLKTMLMMQTGKSGKGLNFFQKTGSILLSGKRNDSYLSFVLDVEILPGEK